MLAQRSPAPATMLRLAVAALAIASWAVGGPAARGWALALLLAANLGIDLLGGRLARPAAPGPDLVLSKAVYAILFLFLALYGRLPPWLALALVGRDALLLLGFMWLRRRTGQWPMPSGHERWPTQALLAAVALLAAGLPQIEPLVLLLFSLLLTRLPAFWFHFFDLVDPAAYHPDLDGELEPAAGWRGALRRVMARPATRLMALILPVGLLLSAVAVWLVGAAVPAQWAGAAVGLERMSALLGRSAPCPGWESSGQPAMLAYLLLLPAALLVPPLVGLHLREATLRRPLLQPARFWPGLLTAAGGALAALAWLAAYLLAGRVVLGPALTCLVSNYTGVGLLALNAVLLSLLVLSYPGRFPTEPPLQRLQLSGASLSTPFVVLLLGQLLGLFTPLKGGIVLVVTLFFFALVVQWRSILELVARNNGSARRPARPERRPPR